MIENIDIVLKIKCGKLNYKMIVPIPEPIALIGAGRPTPTRNEGRVLYRKKGLGF
jgi:hypothetical protein